MSEEKLSQAENGFITEISQTPLTELTATVFDTLKPPSIKTDFRDLSEMSGFTDIVPDQKYHLVSEGEAEHTASFNSAVLSQIASIKIPAVNRKHWWEALLKGVIKGNPRKGIKLMKTSDGVTFAQIKSIGLVAGSKRIYGIIRNNHISFSFVDKDTVSETDPIHTRVKKLFADTQNQ